MAQMKTQTCYTAGQATVREKANVILTSVPENDIRDMPDEEVRRVFWALADAVAEDMRALAPFDAFMTLQDIGWAFSGYGRDIQSRLDSFCLANLMALEILGGDLISLGKANLERSAA